MKKTIKIYQADMNCKYVFRGYDEAKENFTLLDYTKVAEYQTNIEDDDKILRNVWNDGNDGTLQEFFTMRSVSMSDVIQIDNKYYYVDTFGFEEL